jgi:hypothetical protein
LGVESVVRELYLEEGEVARAERPAGAISPAGRVIKPGRLACRCSDLVCGA